MLDVIYLCQTCESRIFLVNAKRICNISCNDDGSIITLVIIKTSLMTSLLLMDLSMSL